MKSRLISASLALVTLLNLLPAAVMAEGVEADKPAIEIVGKDVSTTAGTVKVDVNIVNNPGIVTATIPVSWDPSVLTLTEVIFDGNEYGLTQLKGLSNGTSVDLVGWIGAEIPEGGVKDGIYYLAWDNDIATSEFTGSKLCTLEFALASGIQAGTKTEITALMDETSVEVDGEVIDILPVVNVMTYEMADLAADMDSAVGTLSFVEKTYIPGDVNEDLFVDDKDVLYLLNHWLLGDGMYPVNIPVDFNKDGSIDDKDVLYLLNHWLLGNEMYPIE